MLRSLVGSEMCIRDRVYTAAATDPATDGGPSAPLTFSLGGTDAALFSICLLYTSDAADDLLCVDLGGRRIIKKNIINNL